MAEIALAWSVIGIAASGLQLAQKLYEFGSTFSSAKEEIDDIARHVNSYSTVLDMLADRFKGDVPIIYKKAKVLVNDLDVQSHELFDKIRNVLPQGENGFEEPNLMQKIAWVFKKSKVELLVGEIECLKSTANLLLTVLFAGREIQSYLELKIDPVDPRKPYQHMPQEQYQYFKAKNALVEYVNASNQLPKLQEQARESSTEPSTTQWAKSSTKGRTSQSNEAPSVLSQRGQITRSLTQSLNAATAQSERQTSVVAESSSLLQDLLKEWVGLDLSDEYDEPGFANANARLPTTRFSNRTPGPRRERSRATASGRLSTNFSDSDEEDVEDDRAVFQGSQRNSRREAFSDDARNEDVSRQSSVPAYTPGAKFRHTANELGRVRVRPPTPNEDFGNGRWTPSVGLQEERPRPRPASPWYPLYGRVVARSYSYTEAMVGGMLVDTEAVSEGWYVQWW